MFKKWYPDHLGLLDCLCYLQTSTESSDPEFTAFFHTIYYIATPSFKMMASSRLPTKYFLQLWRLWLIETFLSYRRQNWTSVAGLQAWLMYRDQTLLRIGEIQSSRANSSFPVAGILRGFLPILLIHSIHMFCFDSCLNSWNLPTLSFITGKPDAITANLFRLSQPTYPALPHQVILVRSNSPAELQGTEMSKHGIHRLALPDNGCDLLDKVTSHFRDSKFAC